MKRTKTFFYVVTVLFTIYLHGQDQITFRQLSIKDGLSQNCAISINQDSLGYLWIATQDGLNRYDGKKFEVYPFNFIDITRPTYSHLGKVYVDRRDNIWCIPASQVLKKLNRATNKFETISEIKNASIIFQDTELNFWIGTYTNGFYKMDPENFQIQKIDLGAAPGGIYAIAEKRKKVIITSDVGIFEVNKSNSKSTIVFPSNFQGVRIDHKFSTIVLDGNGRQWFGTYGGGLYFRDTGEAFLSSSSELPLNIPLPQDLIILCLYLDSKERLWIGTYGQGLFLIDLKNYTAKQFMVEKYNPKALHYNDILSIYEDYTGTIWFGTDGAGLSYYDVNLEKFNSFTNFQIPENINIDVVRSIAVDASGFIWIGTSGKGLTQYQPQSNSWRTFRKDDPNGNSLLSDRIISLHADGTGDLWIGTQGGGLSILDKKGTITNYIENMEIRVEAINIWDIFKDGHGRFWLGTGEEGLVQFDKRRGIMAKYDTILNKDKGMALKNIRVITEDGDGNLWLGTDADGIAKFDINEGRFSMFQHDSIANSLSINSIKSLYYAPNNVLWIGTYGAGLDVYDIATNTFYNYDQHDGLANNVVYGILPDKRGGLWLSSNKGITKFTPGRNLASAPTIINYTNYDGLASEFNTGAYFSGPDGQLYFGGLEGFYWFKPDEIRKNTISPKTTITELNVVGKPRKIQSGLRLKYNENTVTFKFSSMQYSLPHKNLYKYRLVDYENNWVEAGNTNFVRYTQLPPGAYSFEVKSSNYDGYWNDTPEVFHFTISPPWYFNSWSKSFYALLLLCLGFAIYNYLKWRLKMQFDLRQKEAEALRFKRLNQLKSKLYTDISHEFKTPLTLIAGPIDAKLGAGGLTDTDYAIFATIKRNTKRLVNLVDQLLHMAKLEKGKIKLKVTNSDLKLFLGLIAKSFEFQAEQAGMTYGIEIDDLGDTWYDEDAIEKIVTNLLSNAFKHGISGGICKFLATREDDTVHIVVINSVAGNLSSDTNKLFNRFYQKDEYTDGAGIGLFLVKELVALYKGQITAKVEGNQIQFNVVLPVAKSNFKSKFIFEETIDAGAYMEDKDENDLRSKLATSALPIVLIVEDHKEIRDFLKSVWQVKYTVLEANTGNEGIEKALENIPDLIISDIKMPNGDGIALCNSLKTDVRTSHIPIILLTANSSEENELKGLHSGADDFVAKPFKLKVLEKRVENLIATRRALRNRYSQEYIFKAKDIAVTPTDELFLKKIQEVIDKHLFDPDFTAARFCKEVHMSRMQLHRKLQAYTGLSTTAFIRSERLKQAVQILRTSDTTINEVAYIVGFNTPSYFIKCFKETYKKPPLEYMQDAENQ
ncbi:response regulator [Maribacter polysiphoniae]|nr:hybrid sensor histidine kinase/response regulator transcription factor [Maribacter polysiphoniae]MBD1262182.1 response regulator [Maribacter polysiphoniae]